MNRFGKGDRNFYDHLLNHGRQRYESDLPDRIDQTLACVSNTLESVIHSVTHKGRITHNGITQPDLTDVIHLQRYSSYVKLLRVTSREMAVVKSKSFKAIGNNVNSCDMQDAEKLWVKEVQKKFSEDWQRRFERLGPAISKNGIITVCSRMQTWLRQNWNSDAYMLLPPTHRFTHLYISHLHAVDHSGVDATIAKLQRKFWVPGARRIVKSVRHRCVICKKLSPKRDRRWVNLWMRDSNHHLHFVILPVICLGQSKYVIQ